MAYQIKFTPQANEELDQILIYLETNYNRTLAADLLLKVYDFLDVLSRFPFIGKKEVPEKNIRGIVIGKYIKLFYRVEDTDVILLNFFDTRQNPDSVK